MASSLALSGLASGLDWKSIVTQLIALERVPQDKAKAKVSSLATKQAALDTIKTSLLSVQTAAKALSFGTGTTNPRSAAMQGTTTDASVTTSDAATAGTFKVSVGGTAAGASLLSGTGSLNTGPASTSVLYGKSKALIATTPLLNLTLADYGVTAGTVTVGKTLVTIAQADLSQTVAHFFGGLAAGTAVGTGAMVVGVVPATDPVTYGSGVLSLGASQDTVTGALTLTAPGTDSPQSIGAAGDTSNLLSIMGFSQGTAASTVDSGTAGLTLLQNVPSVALSKLTTGDLGGAGGSEDLYINGVTIGSFDTSTATVGAIVSAINQKTTAGVTAALDPVSQRIVLTSTNPGRTGISVDSTAVGTNLAGLLGLTSNGTAWNEYTNRAAFSGSADDTAGNGYFQRGKALEFNLTFNGQAVLDSSGNALLRSDTNVVDLSKYGFGGTKITLTPSNDISNLTSAATYTAVVSGAASAAQAKINTFISAYNTLKQLVTDNTKITVGSDGKVTTSVLSDNRDVVDLSNTLRTNIFATVVDATNASIITNYNSISKIGLGFDKAGVMSITDATALTNALTNAPTNVDALLNALGSADNVSVPTKTASENTVTQGIGTRISYIADRLTATTGLFTTSTSNITSQTKRLQKQISDLDRTLAAKQKTLENGFIAMERAQSQLQSQAATLTQAFSNTSSK